MEYVTDKLRMAPDRQSMEICMLNVLDTLEKIQTAYRSYHKTASGLCKAHLPNTKETIDKFMSLIYALFGLSEEQTLETSCADDVEDVDEAVSGIHSVWEQLYNRKTA